MRPLYLVLVTIRGILRSRFSFTDSVWAAVFAGLGESVREVDLVGWYREGRVAGAVLAQGVDLSREVQHRVAARILQALRSRVSTDQRDQLRVRVVRLGEPVKTNTER